MWQQVISEIKETRPSLGSFLEQGTLLEITEQKVKIGYSESFLIPLIQKEENQEVNERPLQDPFPERNRFGTG
ncbi:MAG: hypothetical protein MPW15_24690 [Candidatus Manganitrophus sp.]|nr:hypothetical protein [Candidatus Manganitrophus sp.]